MKSAILTGMACLLGSVMTVACSQVPAASVEKTAQPAERAAPSAEKGGRSMMNQSTAGRYIVQVSGDAEQKIQQVFAEYGVHAVHAIGNDLYDFRLNRDPGLEVLKGKAEKSGGMIKSIQPNFIYHIN